MIRFADKEVYNIHLGDMTRLQMLLFFLKNDEQRRAVIFVYDEYDCYYGMVSYRSVLYNEEIEDCIIKDILTVSEYFFGEARKYFEEHSMHGEENVIPVADKNGAIEGFCWDDNQTTYKLINEILDEMEKYDSIPVEFKEYSNGCELVCIMACNEWAYRLYWIFKSHGVEVSVLGEQWKWFDIPILDKYNDYPEYSKFYVYPEKRDAIKKISQSVYNTMSFLYKWACRNTKALYTDLFNCFKEDKINIFTSIAPSKVEEYSDTEKLWLAEKIDMAYFYFHNDSYANKHEIIKKYFGTKLYDLIMSGQLDEKKSWKCTWDYAESKGYEVRESCQKNTLYVIGPCIVSGDLYDFENELAKLLNDKVKPYDYKVIKILVPQHRFDMIENLYYLPVKKNDIVMIIDDDRVLQEVKGIDNIDLKYIYENKENKFIQRDETPLDVTCYGSNLIANEIFNNYLKEKITNILSEKSDNSYIQTGEILSDENKQKINEYLEKIQFHISGIENYNIGSIVMNCNPFTLGHQYLIEYASSKVDYLYVFVVEEDRSYFRFEDRLKLVKVGCSHLNNVIVVPSGNFVLSYDTLPIYFEKSVHQEEKVDATNDLEIFARYIAPELGITKRFAGEEPTDKITKQYNEQMYIILKEFGIEFEEIPRKSCENGVIGASKVRQLLKEKNWEEIKRMVPECTYKFLSDKYI